MKAASVYVPALGRTVRLGRIRPKAVLEAGNYQIVVLQDGRLKVAPRISAHYSRSRDLAPPPESTSWITKGMAAIAQTDGNTQEGDCVIASKLHQIGVWTGNESGTPVLSSDAEALSIYHNVCGAGDQGCVITDVLDVFKSAGLPAGGVNHKIDGYAALDNANQNLVQVCVEVFGPCASLGLNLPGVWANAVQANGFVWDETTDSSVGGHDVPIIDYNAQGVQIATWGMWGTITWKALADKNIVEEAWCELSPDWYAKGNVAPNGFNAPTLAADLALLAGGNVPPLPGPNPPQPPIPSGSVLTLGQDFPAGTYPIMPTCSLVLGMLMKAGSYVFGGPTPPGPTPGSPIFTQQDFTDFMALAARIQAEQAKKGR